MTRKILFATSNAGKVSSTKRVLAQYGIDVEQVKLPGMPELQAPTPDDIANGKVRYAFGQLQVPVMVNDAAFCLKSVGDFPGTNVAPVTSQIKLQGYLDVLARYGTEGERRCSFIDAVAYLDERIEKPVIFVRHEFGTVAREPRGVLPPDAKSPLALVFIPDGYSKTLGEMTPEELASYRSQPRMEKHLHDLVRWLQGSP